MLLSKIGNRELASVHMDQLTSQWPLPTEGIRLITPRFLLDFLAEHPLSEDLYPIAVGYYPTAVAHQMNREAHQNHLLMYCTAGSGRVTVDNRSWQVSSGDIILLPPGQGHSYEANPNDPWTIYWAHYGGKRSDAYTALFELERPVATIGIHASLITDFEALFALRQGGFSRRDLLHIACQLKQTLTGFAATLNRQTAHKGHRIDIEEVHKLMLQHIDRQFDLDALAREASLSKYHFTRKFKALTGHSPIQHFIHLKMQHACLLLDTTRDPVKQVASAVGYSDPYYFSRLFRKVVGSSPKRYRESRHGQGC